eukprot:1891855-Amphidinium_carterae.1
MPPWGSAPAKRFVKMRKFVTSLNRLSGRTPVKLFFAVSKPLTANIARMPPSGSAPSRRFVWMRKVVTAIIARKPPS